MKDNYIVLHIPSYNDLFKLTFSLEDRLQQREKQFPERRFPKLSALLNLPFRISQTSSPLL